MLTLREQNELKKEFQMLSIKKMFARLNLSDNVLYLDEEKLPANKMSLDEIYLNNHSKVFFEKDIRTLCEQYGLKYIHLSFAEHLGNKRKSIVFRMYGMRKKA